MVAILLSLSLAGDLWSAGQDQPGLEVSFSSADKGTVYALLYQQGDSAVVLGHGAIFNKESWGEFRSELTARGLTVLALDFRGYGKSVAGRKPEALYEDVLAAVRYLKQNGARRVSVIGASMGGGAAAQAAANSAPGEIAKLVLLSPVPINQPERIRSNVLFVASRDEALAAGIKAQFERTPEPKRLVLLNGSAHAQHIFKTNRAGELSRLIVDFLTD